MSPAPPISVQGRPSSYFPPRSQGDPLEMLKQTVSHLNPNLVPTTFHPTEHEIQSPACSLMMRPRTIPTLPFFPTALALPGALFQPLQLLYTLLPQGMCTFSSLCLHVLPSHQRPAFTIARTIISHPTSSPPPHLASFLKHRSPRG